MLRGIFTIAAVAAISLLVACKGDPEGATQAPTKIESGKDSATTPSRPELPPELTKPRDKKETIAMTEAQIASLDAKIEEAMTAVTTATSRAEKAEARDLVTGLTQLRDMLRTNLKELRK